MDIRVNKAEALLVSAHRKTNNSQIFPLIRLPNYNCKCFKGAFVECPCARHSAHMIPNSLEKKVVLFPFCWQETEAVNQLLRLTWSGSGQLGVCTSDSLMSQSCSLHPAALHLPSSATQQK